MATDTLTTRTASLLNCVTTVCAVSSSCWYPDEAGVFSEEVLDSVQTGEHVNRCKLFDNPLRSDKQQNTHTLALNNPFVIRSDPVLHTKVVFYEYVEWVYKYFNLRQ